MRLSLRSIRPEALFGSFLGTLDIKLGCEIILLFGLINKVAGVYGLITILVGGTFLQYVFYAYSIGTLFAFLWALGVVKSEIAAPTLLVAHLYCLDHSLVTLTHYGFFKSYWSLPHDGRRTVNSGAQQALIDLAVSRGEVADPAGESDAHRAVLAREVWDAERGFAVWVLIFGWIVKIYFILILYSYAAHLRRATYHTLPLTSRSKATQIAHPVTQEEVQVLHDIAEEDELELEEESQVESKGGSDKRQNATSKPSKIGETARMSIDAAGQGQGVDAGKGQAKGKGKRRDSGSGSDWE